MENKIKLFKERKIKAKEIFEIKKISKKQASEIIEKYHYLGAKKFMYTVAYGLFLKNSEELIGCAVFGVVGGALTLKGWFSVDNSHSNEYFELTRLVMTPQWNNCNATSFLLGNAIKDIKKNFKEVRAIISLADNSRHIGMIYQACNFQYYGLTNKKSDFVQEGSTKIGARCGSTTEKHGVWIERSRKHRYLYKIDKNINVNYKQERYPKSNNINVVPKCCNGTKEVYDKRFGETFTCPRCTGKCEKIK